MPRAFLITPLSAQTAGEEAVEIYDAVQEALRDASQENDVELVRFDDIFAAGVIIQQIKGAIEQADLILAICTGRNAIVFYELSLAEAAGRLQILFAASSSDLPFDVIHRRAQMYGGEESTGLETLRERVSLAIRETLTEAPAVQFEDPPPAASRIAGSIARSENPLDLVRAGDRVGYIEAARSLIREVREFLKVRGIDPSRAALAVLYPDDVRELVAVIVVSIDRMFEVDIDYPEGIGLAEVMEHGRSSTGETMRQRSAMRISSLSTWPLSCSARTEERRR
jgi:hypothetical protein